MRCRLYMPRDVPCTIPRDRIVSYVLVYHAWAAHRIPPRKVARPCHGPNVPGDNTVAPRVPLRRPRKDATRTHPAHVIHASNNRTRSPVPARGPESLPAPWSAVASHPRRSSLPQAPRGPFARFSCPRLAALPSPRPLARQRPIDKGRTCRRSPPSDCTRLSLSRSPRSWPPAEPVCIVPIGPSKGRDPQDCRPLVAIPARLPVVAKCSCKLMPAAPNATLRSSAPSPPHISRIGLTA